LIRACLRFRKPERYSDRASLSKVISSILWVAFLFFGGGRSASFLTLGVTNIFGVCREKAAVKAAVTLPIGPSEEAGIRRGNSAAPHRLFGRSPTSILVRERPASQQHDRAQLPDAMQLSRAATLLACTAAVQAFSDSSPFILFSTVKCVHPTSRPFSGESLVADTVLA